MLAWNGQCPSIGFYWGSEQVMHAQPLKSTVSPEDADAKLL